jgi:DsrE/DsrF-like family
VSEKQPTLVIISEDPRVSPRANEAMRIALGVVAGENEVRLVLTGPAVHLLDEDTDELMDGDDILKYRAALKKLGILFHIVEPAALPTEPGWNVEGHAVSPITAADLAALVSRASRFIVF